MQRSRLGMAPLIEEMEQRRLFSVELGVAPQDLGALSSTYSQRISVESNNTGLPYAFAFKIPSAERVSFSTAPKGPVVPVRLLSGDEQVAYNTNCRSVSGLLSAGSYTLLATALPGEAYTLVVRVSAVATGTDLFGAAGEVVAHGYVLSSGGASAALAQPVADSAKVAATVISQDYYSFSIPKNGQETATLQSPDSGDLSLQFLNASGGAESSTGVNPQHLIAAAGSYLVEIIDQAIGGVPTPYHLSLKFKSVSLSANQLPVASTSGTAAQNEFSNAWKDPGTASGTPTSSALLTYAQYNGSSGAEQNSSSDASLTFTYFGNPNLNGQAAGSESTPTDNSSSNTSVSGWNNGDFNYDGVVNGSDYSLLNNIFNDGNAADGNVAGGNTSNSGLLPPLIASPVSTGKGTSSSPSKTSGSSKH